MPSNESNSDPMWEIPIYVQVQARDTGQAIRVVEGLARALSLRRVVVRVSVGLAVKLA